MDALHGVVEVAGDLHRQGAVVERLGEFAVRDFAAADEDDGFHQSGRGAEDGERCAGVAGAGAGGAAGAGHAGVRERRRHAVVFEAAGRIQALILQEKPTGIEADIGCDRVGFLQDRLALADGENLLRRRERQQFTEAPDAAEAERIAAVGPLRLEVAQRFRRLQPVPIVGDVHEAAALRTLKRSVIDASGRGAIGIDTALINGVGH